ncbi:sugar transferase [Aminobacter anthyllidis]|uniref:Sugar transferase n=1 Tax=Aminobacter anthyllidis TaxID=1035067 RepID=A0A9X1D8P4_9HYPH|nr:sugar transferase [Aminobacter anthyllidis]MBT1159346.1 sugar transferase [Aminobacter anthyllidis]
MRVQIPNLLAGQIQVLLPQPVRLDYPRVKRVIDIVVVILGAPAAVLIIAACCLAIFLKMGRPVFFVQNRTGLGGRIFKMYKLRTMNLHPTSDIEATSKDDPRVTPLGRFLRRSHFDELPQLLNILRGDMTLIGPRPEQPELVAAYRSSLSDYDLRHTVVPGLTGCAQVYYGYASDLRETQAKLFYDLYYVRNIGPALDFRIALRTLLVYSDPHYVR